MVGNKLAEKGGEQGGALRLPLAQVGRAAEHFISFLESHSCSRMGVGAKRLPRRWSAAWFRNVRGGILAAGCPRVKDIRNTRGHKMLPLSVVQGRIEWCRREPRELTSPLKV